MGSLRNLGRYRLVAALAEGGMARVYLAVIRPPEGEPLGRLALDELRVLKVMRGNLGEEHDLRAMFATEARIAAALNDPNVVRMYEVGEAEGRFFIAMEFLEGESLAAMLETIGRDAFSVETYVHVISQVLLGLHGAHEARDERGAPMNLVHCDVSPQNVFVTYDGQCKLVDFGIAKIVGTPRTQSGLIKGKAGYIAPEQIDGRAVDRRADVFAVGVMLWEAIMRRRFVPRVSETNEANEILARRLAGDEPKIRAVVPDDAPRQLVDICEKAMSRNPEDRYSTALELRSALESYLGRPRDQRQSELTALLENTFRDRRKRTRELIEKQLSELDDSMPLVHIARETTVTMTTRVPSLGVMKAAGVHTRVRIEEDEQVQARPHERAPHVPTWLWIVLAILALVLTAIGSFQLGRR